MSEFRTFSGKTVDEAMEEACRHFAAPREKLEVEILSGGSSGIFGLVGKKKAQVKARLRKEINLLQDMAAKETRGEKNRAEKNNRPPKPKQPKRQAPATAPEEPKPAPVAAQQPAPVAAQPDVEAPEPDTAPVEMAEAAAMDETVIAASPAAPAVASAPADEPISPDDDMMDADDEEDIPPATQAAPHQPIGPELEAIVREVVEHMLDGILGEIPKFEISGHSERVSVLILDEENSGLLIGRDGQTLSSIQYLVNRIVIRRYGNPVKVQINTGEYRERQDENLRKMAIFLADKAKTLGRPQSTKPLSSYHRRVVHLALQEDEAVSTRSKGEGPLKRVLILPRGGRGEAQGNQQQRS